MGQLQISNLDLLENVGTAQTVVGGITRPTFSAQVAAGATTKVVLDKNISFPNKAEVAYAAGYAGAGAVGASINGQASATIFVYAS